MSSSPLDALLSEDFEARLNDGKRCSSYIKSFNLNANGMSESASSRFLRQSLYWRSEPEQRTTQRAPRIRITGLQRARSFPDAIQSIHPSKVDRFIPDRWRSPEDIVQLATANDLELGAGLDQCCIARFADHQ